MILETFGRAESLISSGPADGYSFAGGNKGPTGLTSNHLRSASLSNLHLVTQTPHISHRSVDKEAQACDRLENVDDESENKKPHQTFG
jgi:hypothetical protein